MNFTGERYVPQLRGQIYYEHFHRYALGVEMVANKDVLDVACGEGYGSALLATKARSVVGVDIDENSTRHAAARYPAMNLSFRTGSARQIPLADDSIDVIVSFETIEHLVEQEQMMQEFLRVLRPHGLLLISSPNRLVYSDERGYSNPYHVRELYFHEFRDLLRSFFSEVAIYGQRIFGACAVYPIGADSTQMRWLNPALSSDTGFPGLPGAEYYIGVCSRDSGVALPSLATMYLDLGDDLLSYLRTTGLTSSDTALHFAGRLSRPSGIDEQRALDAGPPLAGVLPSSTTPNPLDESAAGDEAKCERAERERIEETYRSLEREYLRVTDELTSVRGLYGDLERKIAAVQQERTRVSDSYKALEDRYLDLERRYAQIEPQLTTATAQLEIARTSEAKLTLAVAERDAGHRQIDLLQSALGSTEASLEITKRALDNAHALVDSNRTVITAYQQRLEELEEKRVGKLDEMRQPQHTRQLALTLGRMDLVLGAASEAIQSHERVLSSIRDVLMASNKATEEQPRQIEGRLRPLRLLMRGARVFSKRESGKRDKSGWDIESE